MPVECLGMSSTECEVPSLRWLPLFKPSMRDSSITMCRGAAALSPVSSWGSQPGKYLRPASGTEGRSASRGCAHSSLPTAADAGVHFGAMPPSMLSLTPSCPPTWVTMPRAHAGVFPLSGVQGVWSCVPSQGCLFLLRLASQPSLILRRAYLTHHPS